MSNVFVTSHDGCH